MMGKTFQATGTANSNYYCCSQTEIISDLSTMSTLVL